MMNDTETPLSTGGEKIIISKNGPYKVRGRIPLVLKTQVVSEYGEPLTWEKLEDVETERETYLLCRCGRSQNMPFCDGTHLSEHFDGTETARTDAPARWQLVFPSGSRLVVTKDPSLCMNSGFCNLRDKGIVQFSKNSDDTQIRSLAIAMVERCPSGSLTYKFEPEGKDIEPDYPRQVADTIEIVQSAEITGPLWVTGWIPIERSDGKPFLPRNRVTLCNCGQSANKPLCDGTHRRTSDMLKKRKRGNKS